jgi:hypothetical protein
MKKWLKKEAAWDLLGGVGAALIGVGLFMWLPPLAVGWWGLSLVIVGMLGATRQG